ncbi:TOBE domain-containing protein [Yinghuangia aomiensis]
MGRAHARVERVRGVADGTGIRVRDGGHTLSTAEPVPAGPVLATVHPDHVTLHRERPEGSARNTWPGTVAEVTGTGTRLRVTVRGTDGPDVVAEVTAAAAADLGVGEGLPVWVGVKATRRGRDGAVSREGRRAAKPGTPRKTPTGHTLPARSVTIIAPKRFACRATCTDAGRGR